MPLYSQCTMTGSRLPFLTICHFLFSIAGSYSVYLDGVDDFLAVSMMNNWFNERQVDAFTISLWIYLESLPKLRAGIFQNGDCSDTPSVGLIIEHGFLVAYLATGPGEADAPLVQTNYQVTLVGMCPGV